MKLWYFRKILVLNHPGMTDVFRWLDSLAKPDRDRLIDWMRLRMADAIFPPDFNDLCAEIGCPCAYDPSSWWCLRAGPDLEKKP